MKTIIKTNNGSFEGVLNKEVIEFKGIRYGDCELFDYPKEHFYDDKEVVKCDKDAPFSLQLNSSIERFLTGMDYRKVEQVLDPLFLSITLPKDFEKRKEKLPVIVFIHGGTYKGGGCDSLSYDRSYMVKENDVIFVGINYRLGILGFTKDKNGNLANLGLLDIILALKWINKNIEFFNGDKNNVTLYGQSAGADAVRLIMLSEGTEDLYKRVIIHSDPVSLTHNRKKDDLKVLDCVNKNLNNNSTFEEIQKVEEDILKDLKLSLSSTFMKFSPHYGVYPLIKEKDIKKRLKEIASTHDLCFGYNTREVSVYLKSVKIIKKLYKLFVFRKLINLFIKISSNKLFKKDAIKYKKIWKKSGGNAYNFEFSYLEHKNFFGGCHSLDFYLMFNSLQSELAKQEIEFNEDNRNRIAKEYRRMFANYIKYGKFSTFEIKKVIKIIK